MPVFTYKIGAQGVRDRAKQFMGNDIIRGIVELITNSDAAYSASGEAKPGSRLITILYNSAERWFEIRDRAGGMTPGEVEDKFTEGGATSAEGQRGYFGLGAKDCAVFGSLNLTTIDRTGNLTTQVHIPSDFEQCSLDSRQASDKDYEEMHGTMRRRAGTVVRISVDRHEQGGAHMPQFDNLIRSLRSHYALRSLLQRSSVKLRSVGRTKLSGNVVYPGFPWENPGAECLHDGDIGIAGYPDSHPRLKLFKLPPNSLVGDPSSEAFEGFLLIGTKDIADYGFTLAGRETRDHAKRLVGYVDDSYIQTLLTEYRQYGSSGQNPRPVVSQERRPRNGGLDSDHPYTKALFAALAPVIDRALSALQSESREQERSGVSEGLQRANEEAGRQLSQILDAGGEGLAPKPLPEGFYFLPTSRALKRGSEHWESLSLYLILEDDDSSHAGAAVDAFLEDQELCDMADRTVTLRERSGTDRGQMASIRLKALDRIGRTTLTATTNGKSAQATISVEEAPPPPLLFQFERARYSVQPSRRRSVRVLIPEFLAKDDADADVTLSISDANGGVVIRGTSRRAFDEGGFDVSRLAYVVPFEIEGRQVGARASLTASFQNQKAVADLVVGGGTLQVLLDDRETSPPHQRAKVYDVGDPCSYSEHESELCLHVFARHPRVERYLGEPRDSADSIFWDLNDSPGFRAMFAECLADAVTEFQMSNWKPDSVAVSDQGDVLSSFWEIKKKNLTATQNIYIMDDMWRSQKKLLGLPS